jgi:dipeptidase E
MKLLLTSGGISNESIRAALVEFLGKPISESAALCVPTAIYAFSGGTASAWRLITGQAPTPLCGLGWKSLGVLELTALPSIDRELWVASVRECDALLVGGGDPGYLAHWMRASGLAELVASLPELVYVGVSAGSLVMGPKMGEEFVYWRQPHGRDEGLGWVDFSMFPHLDHPALPDHAMARAERWAAGLGGPGYAMDDQTAIRVADGVVDVISEGSWRRFGP